MFRKALNAMTRISGWNAVGKRVLLISGEGPNSPALKGCSGLIKSVSTSRFGQEVIQVILDRVIVVNTVSLTEIFLVPRHLGYGSIALATTSIAAYVVDTLESVNEPTSDKDSILALMDVRLIS